MSNSPSDSEDLAGEPPSSINPYEVLGISETATADEVKSAYRKSALRYHPDKATPSTKAAATRKFQEVAFSYAILSDERRRKRYDLTGSTEESLDLEDDDFDWTHFYREQFRDAISGALLDQIKKDYQNSAEEKNDLLSSFEKAEGNLDEVFEEVMMSNPLEDEQRFRAIIDTAIDDGIVEAYEAYTNETTAKRKQRAKKAKREEQEAMEMAKELGVEEKLFGKGKKKGSTTSKKDNDGEASLLAIIQQRQKGRAATFLDNLEAKYGAPNKSQRGKNRNGAVDEPPEEAFQRNAKRSNGTAKDQESSKKTRRA
ncbi:MAG: hypothetical protein M1825_000125 [Sarcosagium campestre]|nr:MAG: hypothetical protein M1825_000125 [Sarcosagium campestre]